MQAAGGRTGVILDVDGTLWDAVKVVKDSWNDYRRRKIPEMPGEFTDADIEGVLGKTMTEIADILLSPLSGERRYQVMDGIMEHEVAYMREHGGSVYSGVKETFLKLREQGYEIYIVSNCQKGYIEDFLNTSGTVELVKDHVCFGDTGKSKDVSIRLCAERNHLTRAVYVGDTEGDLISARKAGLPFIYASYGFGNVDPEAEKVAVIRSFPDLPEVLPQVLA